MTFPSNFLWGVATAGYQVEGGINNNDWHHFVNSREIVQRVRDIGGFDNQEINLVDPGDALNHQNMDAFDADLERAIALGATTYRMSMEWSRLQPTRPERSAPHTLDPFGLDFYTRRVSTILTRGLVLHVTLNHLTLPEWVLTPPVATSTLANYGWPGVRVAIEDDQYLAHRGWENVETADLFAHYAVAVVEYFHSLFVVRGQGQIFWATFNEPVGSTVGVGYFAGVWPPGFTLDGGRGRTAYFNILRAHILAYDAIKEVTSGAAQVGIVHNMIHAQRTNASSAVSTAGVGAATVTVIGGLIGGGIGAAVGAALCGFWCALLGFIIGGIAGAVAAAASGAAAGGISGAAIDYHEEARRKFDYFYNEHLLNALVLRSVDMEISVAQEGRRILDLDAFIRASDPVSFSSGSPPRAPVPDRSHLDFLGINYYRTVFVYHDAIFASRVPYAGGIFKDDLRATDENRILVNDLGWGIHPDGLAQIVTRVHRTYSQAGARLPIIISENGCAENADKLRAPYTTAHLEALERAMQEDDLVLGRPNVLGYIHWTLADNYEWHHGYNDNSRFGLFSVDRQRPHTRRITEAAFAFHALSRSGDPAVAREKFGSINHTYPSVIAPSLSPGALWRGIVDREPVLLWLTRINAASIQGMLYYAARDKWLRIDDVDFNDLTKAISFSHSAATGIATRRFAAVVNGPRFERGVCTETSAGESPLNFHWVVLRDPVVGTWLPTSRDREGPRNWSGYAGWQMLSLECWDNYWRVKLLWDRCSWESIRDLRIATEAGVTTVRWSATNGRFEATLVPGPTGNLLQGTFSPGTSGSDSFLFEAWRISDGLPF